MNVAELPDLELPTGTAYRSVLPHDRRELAARKELKRRVRREFEELPGLSLTLAQARRLFYIEPGACSRILDELIDEGFLRLTAGGSYVSHSGVPYDRART